MPNQIIIEIDSEAIHKWIEHLRSELKQISYTSSSEGATMRDIAINALEYLPKGD